MRHLTLLIAGILLAFSPAARAAEGMFLLDRLPIPALKKAGLKVSAAKLLTLSRAVVRVARGGTGSFVSPKGLVVTNHHVAYRCLARLNASKKHVGLMKKGFLAKTLAAELPCAGYDLLVVQKVLDVTARVNKRLSPKLSWQKRHEAIRLKKQDLVDECQKSKRFICEVKALDGGIGYLLSVFRRIRDVRLVYAPPGDLGKYGGDIDNWMFPRHTADFTFLRGYVSPDGRDVPYNAKNVPLKTPVYLQTATEGFKRDDLALVIGFPGRTSRHVTSHEVRFFTEVQVPAALSMLGRFIALIHAEMKKSPEKKRKYVGLEAGLQNAHKYYKMIAKGMQRWNVKNDKQTEEKKLLAGAKDKKRQRKLRGLLKKTEQIYDGLRTYYHKVNTLNRIAGWGSRSFRVAYDIVKWGREKEKPNRMRKKQRYKDKNVGYFVRSARRLEKEVDLDSEQQILTFFLKRNLSQKGAHRLKATNWLLRWAKKAKRKVKTKLPTDPLEAAVALLYRQTKLFGRDVGSTKKALALRDKLFKMKSGELKRVADPLLKFAMVVEKEHRRLTEGPFKRVTHYLKTVLHPEWVKVKRATYPDANSTVRLTWGRVADYTSAETKKTHRYLTGLKGLLRKEKGKYPFRVPPQYKKPFQSPTGRYLDVGLKDIPVNFTTTLDTTGGNSGSPVLDARGMLIGLLFDGTPEAVLSDWQYRAKEQRSICVDIRYALYLANLDGAVHLLQELGVRPQ